MVFFERNEEFSADSGAGGRDLFREFQRGGGRDEKRLLPESRQEALKTMRVVS
jgi:hypothetical protein